MATFTNMATLSFGDRVVNSNVVQGEILDTISVSKTAVPDTYTAGDAVTYIISIINSGNAPISGLTLVDDLGAYTEGDSTLYPLTYIEGTVRMYVNGVLQTPPTVIYDNTLTINNITVPAGGNITLVYSADVNSFADPDVGGSIINTVIINGVSTGPATATETITAAAEPILNITKSLSPNVVSENGTITYTFVIQNNGNTAAASDSDIVVRDVFDPILENITVTLNGNVLSEEDYTYNTENGVFSTTAGVVTVPAATFVRDEVTGIWVINPGVTVLTVSGTI